MLELYPRLYVHMDDTLAARLRDLNEQIRSFRLTPPSAHFDVLLASLERELKEERDRLERERKEERLERERKEERDRLERERKEERRERELKEARLERERKEEKERLERELRAEMDGQCRPVVIEVYKERLAGLNANRTATRNAERERDVTADVPDEPKVWLKRFSDPSMKGPARCVTAPWSRLMDALEDCARQQFGELVPPGQQIRFCFYLNDAAHRTPLKHADQLRAVFGDVKQQSVFFWVDCGDAEPVSPDALFTKVARLEDCLQRLSLGGSTSAIMEQEWSKRSLWRRSDVAQWLQSVDAVRLPAELHELVQTIQNSKTEHKLQEGWRALLKKLDPCVIDSHASSTAFHGLVEHNGTKHFPDFTKFVGVSTTWEALQWLIELKLSIGSDAEWRGAVLQWYSRVVVVLDHQPERSVCVGAVLGAQHVCFVRVERNTLQPTQSRALFVSDAFQCFAQVGGRWTFSADGELLLHFLALSPSHCGHAPVALPTALGHEMQSCLRRGTSDGSWLYICDGDVYKVGPCAAAEVEVLTRLTRMCVIKVCPVVRASDAKAFAMEQCDELRSLISKKDAAAVDLLQLATTLFWSLFAIHACGIIHSDVKPSNVLRDRNNQFLLCDFDAALAWRAGDGLIERHRSTPGFSDSPFVVRSGPHDWDLEGLYWTLVYVWARQDRSSQWSEANWKSSRAEFAVKAALDAGPLQPYFAPASFPKTLLHPNTCMAAYVALLDGSDDGGARGEFGAWVARVRAVEREKQWFACPEELLQQRFAQDAAGK